MEFIYRAQTTKGEDREGTIEATTEEQAIAFLHHNDLLIVSLKPAVAEGLKRDLASLFRRSFKKELIIFTRQLATLVEADMPLLESLRVLEAQSEEEEFQKIVGNIAAAIENGSSLSIALEAHA